MPLWLLFVINHWPLWQITKTSKVCNKKSVRKFRYLSLCPRNTQVQKASNFLEQCSYKDDFSSLQIVKFALERTILGVFWFLKIILSLELQSPRGLPFLSCCVSSDLTGRQLASNRNSLPNKGQQSCDTVPLSSFFSISKFEWSRYQFVPLEYLACLL